MSYNRKSWQGEEIIYANDLNNIENGIEDIEKRIFDTGDLEINSIQEQINDINNNVDTINGNISGINIALTEKGQTIDEILNNLDEVNDSLEFKELLINQLNGRPIMRHREEFSSINIAMQNGTIYSPDGNYAMDASVKYIYFWQTQGNDQNTKLRTYRVYSNNPYESHTIKENSLIHTTEVLTHGGHGGSLIIQEGLEGDDKTYMYSITQSGTNKYLYKFDLTDPEQPVPVNANGVYDVNGELIYGSEQTEPNNTEINRIKYAVDLVGWIEEDGDSYWLGVTDKNGGAAKQNQLIRIDRNFSGDDAYIVDDKTIYLENPIDILTQDFKYDSKRKLIYHTTCFPNLIIFYNLKGELITIIKFPNQHMSYVNCGEIEWADVHDNMIYCGGICNIGVSGDQCKEYNAWGCDLKGLHSVRQIQNSVTGRREIKVYGPNLHPEYKFNPPCAQLDGDNLKFAYAEDAFNCIRDSLGGAGSVSFLSHYPYAFQVPCDCELIFNTYNTGTAPNIVTHSYITHPFKILKNVTCNIKGLQFVKYNEAPKYGWHDLSSVTRTNTTTGNTEAFSVKYQVCFDVGSKITTTGMSDLGMSPNNGYYSVVIDRAEFKVTNEGQIARTLCWHGSIIGQAHIMNNIHCAGGYIDCRWWDIRYSNSQKVDMSSVIRSPIVVGESDGDLTPNTRPKLYQLRERINEGSASPISGTHCVPTQCVVIPQYGLVSNIYIFNEKAFEDNPNEVDTGDMGFSWAGADAGYTYRITKYKENVLVGGYSLFIAYKYRISLTGSATIQNSEPYTGPGNDRTKSASCVVIPISKR